MFDTLRPFRRLATRPNPATVPLPRRVALFSGNYNYLRDGANQALNRLVAYLERRGTEVRVYSPTSDTPAFEPAGTLVSVPSVRIPGRGDYRLGLGLSAELRRDVRAFRPDIVHVSAPDWTGTAAQRLARTIDVPVVASLHTRFETYAQFYGAGLIRPAMERHLDRFYRGSDTILVPTAPIADEFTEKGFGDRTRLWGRGVDRDQFSPENRNLAWRRSHGFQDDDVVVLFFGRLVREKGPALFADIVDRVTTSGVAVRPLIVGDGPERRWLSKRLPNAQLLGSLSGEELGRAVASADIFVNPSITEAFGNVTLEAMASGLPSVCVDIPSGRNLLRKGTGMFYSVGDIDGAVTAVRRLAVFSDLRSTMSRAARAASEDYSWDRASAMVTDAYHALLSNDDARTGETIGSLNRSVSG
ncbi:glycosyltransferase family 4 protein [Sphingomonas faeni]|uniref:glycosyltransferase family 4 protein n=1 Tax=Sphingomonas faeni TaxID=185950 RepID=UPI00278AFF46|nr:glycosyltransferase family 1 protein [Sphingomonas faeni]MDQ0839962.1 phosphatidylinositol alpha 1,6-mannosyltransferase [Sphingomonas faeni]